MVAVCVSAVPASVNVAGGRLTVSPASTWRLGPASTTGARLSTVTVAVSVSVDPSSSVTCRVISTWVSSTPEKCGCAEVGSSRNVAGDHW